MFYYNSYNSNTLGCDIARLKKAEIFVWKDFYQCVKVKTDITTSWYQALDIEPGT